MIRKPSVFSFSRLSVAAGMTLAMCHALPASAQTPAAAVAKKVPTPPPVQAAVFDGKPYTENVPTTKIAFDMVPIAGGTFTMGTPDKEKGRGKDEGPTRSVTLRPFYMMKYEAAWEGYHTFLEIGIRQSLNPAAATDDGPDALSFPTPPYADETFGFGKGKQPVIAVTWHAAMEYARWISKKTGKNYRLPTEAEWEYACRAGTQTAYSFGDAPAKLGDFALFDKNAKKHPNLTGLKKPNPWGLFDMHGNVSEWTLDQYAADAYSKPAGDLVFVVPGEKRFPHITRGGSWKEKAPALRCGARRFSEKVWSKQDPQNPQSIWWHTEATEVGFRLVHVPDDYPALKGIRSKMTPESAY